MIEKTNLHYKIIEKLGRGGFTLQSNLQIGDMK